MNRLTENKQLFIQEAVLRVLLIIIFEVSDDAPGFRRKILPEEMWLYSYPRMPDYYPSWMLWSTVWGVPAVVFALFYFYKQDLEDLMTALMGVLLSIYGSGSILNMVKLTVGRPRPDFMERCYPDRVFKPVIECTGSADAVIQGYKSFPSGHSCLSFASLAYVALYLAGKLHVFSGRTQGGGLGVLCFLGPLVWATLIAVSRTCDYHHHWQDVTVGSIAGLAMAYCCYRQGYPALNRPRCHLPYSRHPAVTIAPLTSVTMGETLHDPSLVSPSSPGTHAQVTAVLKTQ